MNASDQTLETVLRNSAEALIDEDIDLIHSIDISKTEVSPTAIRRIRRNIKNYEKEPWWNHVPLGLIRVVAAMLVLCTISFGLCMSVAAIRTEFVQTIMLWYDKFTAVFYVTDETPPSFIEEFKEPRLQLNGTEKQTIVQVDTFHMIQYYGVNGLEIEYQQFLLTDSPSDIDNKNCTVKEVQINEYKAQLFSYADGTQTITWHDNEYAYVLFSYINISPDLMIAMAKSVK